MAFHTAIPPDPFLFKPSLSLFHFILCTNNLLKEMFLSLTIFHLTLKAEDRNKRRIFT